MDLMKVIDKTVREIKREVNLKVFKVPEIEQKVLDATNDEPWGPHGEALAEIAQATKKFSECQIVMNVLWPRLSETGQYWRYVYKALAVIEYLVANGSERAVDDIIEHTYQISSLASFEYVEPTGKDMGINVRKKAENIVTLLNNKDKIQEVRNKAAANREKFFGLSSSGITYKSGSASFSSSNRSSFQSSDRSGGFSGTKDSDTTKDKEQFGEEKSDQSTSTKARRGVAKENQGKTSKKGSTRYSSKGLDSSISSASKPATTVNDSDNYSAVPAQSCSAPSNNNYDDDFDDFDPRGASSTKSAAVSSNQVDLFGQSLVGDLMDLPSSVSKELSAVNTNGPEVDLFADSAFVSASPHMVAGGSSATGTTVDLFASQPASTTDFFATPAPMLQSEKTTSKSDAMNSNAVDPFAAFPLNNFDGADVFAVFTSSTDSVSAEATKNPDGSNSNLNKKTSAESLPPAKDNFLVKSGIWADSLSRGLIDLNISAPKRVSLADVGVVGQLSDGLDEREKGPTTSFYTGRAMGAGSGLGRSGFTSSTGKAGDDMFSNLGNQQYDFGSFSK